MRERVSAPGLWNDPDRAKRLTRRLGGMERVVAEVDGLAESLTDAETLTELAVEEQDPSALAEAAGELAGLRERIASLEEESLFFGEYDDRPAIVGVHAGAGGVDAQDWAEMMLRMYVRYLEESGFDVGVDEVSPGEQAGIKSASLTVEGEYAYGRMEGERGVHRLVRISPYDANSRRHTSFAGVDVVPLVEDAQVDLNMEEVRVDTYRSQGAGGQHVNTTDSAVRLTHLPTGIVVACQAERSQLQNRARATTLLIAKLAERARTERRRELDQIRGEQTEAGWGRQIRSYVLAPYQQVKDLRTGWETGNIDAVLDGSLSGFTDAYLQWRRRNRERSGYEDPSRPAAAEKPRIAPDAR